MGAPSQAESPDNRNELAKARNRAAADRTLMAWVRTSLSLIGFGFGIERILEAMTPPGKEHAAWLTPFVTLSFIALGVYGLVAATMDYRHEIQSLERPRYEFKNRSSAVLAVATILAFVGAVAFFGLLMRII